MDRSHRSPRIKLPPIPRAPLLMSSRRGYALLVSYVIAVAATLLATLVRHWLDDQLGEHLRFGTYFVAILFAAWYCGAGPALLVLVLGYLLANFFFIHPRGSFEITGAEAWWEVVLYLVVGLASIGFSELWRAAKRRAQAHAEAHARQREYLRVTLASIGDAVIATDTQGRVTFLNPVAETLTGWQQAEAMGRPLSEIFSIFNEVTGQAGENPVGKALRTGRVVGLANHTILRSRDGTERPVDDSAAPIRDDQGMVVGVILVFRDITKRRYAEAALRHSESQFRELADAMPQIVWAARPDGYLDYYNRRWYEFTGFPEGEGGDDSWKPILHPDDLQLCVDRWYEAVRTGEAYEIEYRFKDRRTGGYRWFLGRALPVRDHTGRIIRWFGTCTDIDDQKRAEESLKEADRRKDEFIALLAHELRNPLAAIRSSIQVLDQLGSSEEGSLKFRTIIHRQSAHLTKLVDELLDVSRIARGRIQLRREPMDLRAVVTRSLEAIRPRLEAKQRRLHLTLPAEPLPVLADPTRVEQIIDNLLNNAAKFTEAGGQIWLTAERDEEWVTLRVRDDGIGIDPEMLPRVFDMFVQAERRTELSQGGLGIGLTLVKNLVELHGGLVDAQSAGASQGSEFIVRLPLDWTPRPSCPVAEAPRLQTHAPSRDQWRILVVDDNADAAESLALFLQLAGHVAKVAYDGPQALDTLRSTPFDLVLLDIGLPQMNGHEVARQIRSELNLNQVRLVALTGWGHDQDRRRSLEAGFDHHLVKPVDPRALQTLLGSLEKPRVQPTESVEESIKTS